MRGAAPMNTNIDPASTVSCSPVVRSESTSRSRCPSPQASATSVPVRTTMLSIASICLIRYDDIEASRSVPRTRIVTSAACREKNTAA